MRSTFIWSFLHKARDNTAYLQLKPRAPYVPQCSPWDVHRLVLPFAPSEDPARSEKACFCWILNTLSPALVYSCYNLAHLWDTSELAEQAQNISCVPCETEWRTSQNLRPAWGSHLYSSSRLRFSFLLVSA